MFIKVALKYNADYLKALEELEQEKIHLRYARNQAWPRIDLQATMGYNGLAEDFDGSWDDFSERDGPECRRGIIFTMPLGNRRARSRVNQAKLRKRQGHHER